MQYLQLTFEASMWYAQIRNQDPKLLTEHVSNLGRSLVQS